VIYFIVLHKKYQKRNPEINRKTTSFSNGGKDCSLLKLILRKILKVKLLTPSMVLHLPLYDDRMDKFRIPIP